MFSQGRGPERIRVTERVERSPARTKARVNRRRTITRRRSPTESDERVPDGDEEFLWSRAQRHLLYPGTGVDESELTEASLHLATLQRMYFCRLQSHIVELVREMKEEGSAKDDLIEEAGELLATYGELNRCVHRTTGRGERHWSADGSLIKHSAI